MVGAADALYGGSTPMADALPSDVQAMSDRELALYLSRSLAALEFTSSLEERHHLAHFVLKVQLEQETRKRKLGSTGMTPKEVSKLAIDRVEDALKK